MCHLTLLYSCPLCLQMTCAHTPQRGGLAAKHFHKGAQRQREMPAEQTNACAHCVWEAQEFQCQTLCDQYNSVWVKKLTRPGSGTFLSWSSESLAQCLPSVWMNPARLSLGKQWTGRQTSKLARGLVASMLREVIVAVEAAKASTTPKAEGGSKNMFSL